MGETYGCVHRFSCEPRYRFSGIGVPGFLRQPCERPDPFRSGALPRVIRSDNYTSGYPPLGFAGRLPTSSLFNFLQPHRYKVFFLS